ncbi:MAG: hypothetical protein ACE15B_18765 [Bryobacteraceae bacterium]
MPRGRVLSIAYWTFPTALMLFVYWAALDAWFQDDDFMWLKLPATIHSARDLLPALFRPTRHGTLRPLSERAYFLIFGGLFGLDPLPFRIWAFATQAANLALLAAIMRRLAGRAAGFWTPVFWVSNSVLSWVMAWNSAYMQILCGFFILLAFWAMLRHAETGRRRWAAIEWGSFLAGFAAMETVVVYPALAAVYAWWRAPQRLKRTLPMFAVSAAYVALHMWLAPKQATGPYAMRIDGRILDTLLQYWRWTAAPINTATTLNWPGWITPAAALLVTAVLAGFTVWSLARRDRLPLLFLAWFVILLAPVLPFPEHRLYYLATLPSIGVAMLCGYALSRVPRAPVVIAAALFLMGSAAAARAGAQWWRARSRNFEKLVLGAARAAQLHRGQTIVLLHVTGDQFWGAVAQDCFASVGAKSVHLAPGSERAIGPAQPMADPAHYVLDPYRLAWGLRNEAVQVYETAGPRLRNVTSIYRATAPRDAAPPRRLNVGDSLTADLLGEGWNPPEDRYRWMGRRGALRLGGPGNAGERLHVRGYISSAVLGARPLGMQLKVEGRPLKPVEITRGDAFFDFDFPLDPALTGRPELNVEVELDRAQRDGARELGAVFGVFEIR